MSDYAWDHSDSLAHKVEVTEETLPNRVALTATQIITRGEDGRQVLLVDPHPAGTWDTWMTPYSSLVLEEGALRARGRDLGADLQFLQLSPGDSLKRLADALDQLASVYQEEYRQALKQDLNNVLPELTGGWQGDPFYTSYSLKFSQTSHSYTAYRFAFYRSSPTVTEVAVDHIWVDASDFRDVETSPTHINGKEVVSNVPVALRQLLNAKE
ncbi:hypothetical protein AGRA3207_002144 [Actinomadura graeca]|uniref:Uncharacterized protein n=1 Tax=Actinomadura graeca TaxID=2750812 RepID=A0ABX8QR82_9ACTN|nr:hypothetical protein [Actinomadura graeca]QXJ21305.1 hypothetical protein AGRA3207_002144 [Actinomadura graeca]